MARDRENQGFICGHCGNEVLPLLRGSYRNHCPFCLYSLHVDIEPGDRLSDCKGLMIPIGVEYNPQKGYQIIHRCETCGFVRKNIRAEDKRQPDRLEVILELMENQKYRPLP